MFSTTYTVLFLLAYFTIFYSISTVFKSYGTTKVGYIVANRNAGVFESTIAIMACWLTALGFMVSGQQLYNNGWAALFWFDSPQVLGMLIFGWLTVKLNKLIPNGFTVSQWIKEQYGAGVGSLFQIIFIISCFSNIVMTATTLVKFITFLEIGNAALISAAILIGILIYSIRGGLKTSLRTSTIQTIMNILLLFGIIYIGYQSIPDISVTNLLTGKKHITDLFDPMLMITFGITAFIVLISGPLMSATHHQKSFAQQNKTAWKAWAWAAPGYMLLQTLAASLGLLALAWGGTVADLSSLQFVFVKALGVTTLVMFAIIMLNIACIVVDSHGNGIASIISTDFVNNKTTDPVLVSKIVLVIVAWLAWGISLFNFDLTYILFIYGILRTNLFVILITIILSSTILTRRGIFWAGAIMCPVTSIIGIYGMIIHQPILNIISACLALFVTPAIAYTISKMSGKL